MDTYVLDTNIFFNMEAGLDLGAKTEDVVRTITAGIQRHKTANTAQFFTPPAIIEEFLSFFEDKNQDFIQLFLATITVKSPHIHRDQIAASVFYTLVEDIRARSYRGLSIGCEIIQNTAQSFAEKTITSKIEREKTVGPFIKSFRERYRQATRVGFLDSVADLDLIMLAREQNAAIVSADEGVLRWGRIFGVREIDLSAFGKIIRG